jgi:hypothetical protein
MGILKKLKLNTQFTINPPRLCPVCNTPLIFNIEFRYLTCPVGCSWNHSCDELPEAIAIGIGYFQNRRYTHYRVNGIKAEFIRTHYCGGLQTYRLDKHGCRLDGLFLELLPPDRWIATRNRKRKRPKDSVPKADKAVAREQARETARLQAESRAALLRLGQDRTNKSCPAWAVELMAKQES